MQPWGTSYIQPYQVNRRFSLYATFCYCPMNIDMYNTKMSGTSPATQLVFSTVSMDTRYQLFTQSLK